MQILTTLGALDLSNIDASAIFADASGRIGEMLQSLGRDEEARQGLPAGPGPGRQGALVRRPGNRMALHGQQICVGVLVAAAADNMQMAELQKAAKRQVEIGLALVNLDPGNVASQFNLGLALFNMGDINVAVGRLADAVPNYQRALEYRRQTKGQGGAFGMIYLNDLSQHADQSAQIGDMAAATKMLQQIPEVQAEHSSEVNGKSSLLWTIA